MGEVTPSGHIIEFDAERHVYTVEGRITPSVTQVISAAGLIDSKWFTEESRIRGSYVHRATELLDANDLFMGDIPPEYMGYISAWMRFKREADFTPELREHRVYHPKWHFCGTLDRTGFFGLRAANNRALLDIKTGVPAPWHPLQVCAYTKALTLDEPDDYRKMTVLLRKDGTFKVNEYQAGLFRDYWNTFLGCMTVCSFRMEHGYESY